MVAVSCRKENLVRMNLNADEIGALTDDVIRRMSEVGDAVAAVKGERTYFPRNGSPVKMRRRPGSRRGYCPAWEALAGLCTRFPTLWAGSRSSLNETVKRVASPLRGGLVCIQRWAALPFLLVSATSAEAPLPLVCACKRSPLSLLPFPLLSPQPLSRLPSPVSRTRLPSPLSSRAASAPRRQVRQHHRAARAHGPRDVAPHLLLRLRK